MASSKIVITDGFTLNPGDLDWRPLQEFGDVVVYDRTREREILDRVFDADVIITNKTPLSANVIQAASRLKLIAVTATGYNIIDTHAADQKRIPVCNVPGYGTDSVAQHTFALILELTNHVGLNAASVASGEWSVARDWCYTKVPIAELAGKTLGIVGYGKIGQKVADVGRAFGMRVIFYNPSPREDSGSTSLEEVFSKSDIITLHCPLTRDNAGFVTADLLSKMRSSALFINTSRGQLVNENDLAQILGNGKIAGAALDVLSKEPPDVHNPLIGLRNCIVTPHNAWLSLEARQRIMQSTINNVALFFAGKPQNVVNLISSL